MHAEKGTNPNLSHLVKCCHFYPLNYDHYDSEQTASCDGASAPPQTSLVADNLLPARHMPEMVAIQITLLDIRQVPPDTCHLLCITLTLRIASSSYSKT